MGAKVEGRDDAEPVGTHSIICSQTGQNKRRCDVNIFLIQFSYVINGHELSRYVAKRSSKVS